MKFFIKTCTAISLVICLENYTAFATSLNFNTKQLQIDTVKHSPIKSKFKISPKLIVSGLKKVAQKTNSFLSNHEVSIGPSGSFNMLQDVYIYDIGLQAGFKIHNGFRLNLDATYRSDFNSSYTMHWGSVPIDVSINNRSTIFSGQLDWFPLQTTTMWRPLKLIKVIGGVRWVTNPSYASTASLHEALIFGQYTFQQQEIGSVNVQIHTKNFQPYLGLGIDPSNNRKRFNMGLQGGILYQGKPTVAMQANNMLRATVENAPILEKELASFQFIPFFKVFTHINF
jgi:hypothetical protein